MQLVQSLHAELRNAILSHYKELTARCTDDVIYGYSLFTDDCVSSIGPVAVKEGSIQVKESDPMYNYYRYGVVEWTEWDDFGMFDEVNQTIRNYHETVKDSFEERVTTLLQASLDVLIELESTGLFGPRNDSRFLVICVSDSENEIMIESAQKLNTSKVCEDYASEFA
ncbi:DUF4303 domain-containing protein [Paenibacillus sp. FJAT-26967]|uniref:DUF4303 domain-containing protein n=1 Tax=Paenibacillus sp. FJAT-26967 TaxID=1729690 RepID=UPI000838128F|nr:DUF4303 domain-containing protein [Paenibacillus sp. FJAT-26967]